MKKYFLYNFLIFFTPCLLCLTALNARAAPYPYSETKLVASDSAGGDIFGSGVSLSGNVIAVGSGGNDASGRDSGAAYVFRHSGTTWVEEAKLMAGDGAANDMFGHFVSIDRDILLITADHDDDDTGSAYIFRYNGMRWAEEAKLIASDASIGDRFGCCSASLKENLAVIPAPFAYSAYVFRHDGISWIQEAKLEVDSRVQAVSTDYNTIAVGAQYAESVYIYRYNGTYWVQEAKIVASDADMGEFGKSVSISDNVLVIGAWRDDDMGSSSGSAHIYRYDGVNWNKEAKITASDGAAGDYFGFSVAISNSKVLVGANHPDGNSGSAYIFKFDGAAWSEELKLIASDGADGDNFGAEIDFDNDTIVVGSVRDDVSGNEDAGSAYVYETSATQFYTPVAPCRIVDTRKQLDGIIGANSQRNFNVYGDGIKIGAQGGNSVGCPAPMGEPLAAHINIIAVNPTGKGNLQAFPVGARTGAGLSVNYNTIDTNLANAGTVKTITGSGPDITVASNFSAAHTVIDVLGYFYPNEGLSYTPVIPCRIVDTRYTSAGIIDANTERNFSVFGSGGTIFSQGGDPNGCPSPLEEPLAAHINMVAVYPYGKGNLQAFPVGAGTGAGLSVNYNIFDTNLANAGIVKTNEGAGTDITVASNFSSANTVIDVLGYFYPDGDLVYTSVKPCRIVDTRKTSAGIINANTERNFSVYGSDSTISAQGGNSVGCSSPQGEPLAVHINMIAVDPTGKGNLQVFPLGTGPGAGLSVNYNTIDTNLANAGTVKTVTGTVPDITVASSFSSAHAVIDVLGYYYPAL